jgi:hypothetical protein
MNTLDAASKNLERYINDRINEIRAYRGIVVGQSGGMVQIRPVEATTGQTALRARCVGFELANDDEVLYIKVNKLPVVIAQVQRGAVQPFELEAALEVPALTVNGVPVTGSAGLTIKHDGTSIDTDITTIDFLAPLTATESPENEINIDVDVGTGATQVAAGNHDHAGVYATAGHTHAADEVFIPFKGVNANPGLATASTWGMPAALLNATAANDDDDTGPYVSHTTGAVSGNATSIRSDPLPTAFRRDWLPELEMVVKLGPTISSYRFWAGMFDAVPNSASDPVVNGAAFRYATDVDGTAFWRTWSNDGVSTGNAGATTVAVVAGQEYVLRLKCLASSIEFYIDDVEVAEHSTNLPGATTMLGYNISLATLTAAARAFSWSRIRIAHGP